MTLTKTENIMETKFTKGEWEVGNKNYIQVNPGNPLETITIGSVFGSGDEAEANAKLIAAAPDMYEALKLVIEICEVEEKNKIYGQNEKHWTNVVLRAFKKATE